MRSACGRSAAKRAALRQPASEAQTQGMRAAQGTLLRTALALGWGGALLLPGCCDPFNDKALRASRGAAFRLPLAPGTWQVLNRSCTVLACLVLGDEVTPTNECS